MRTAISILPRSIASNVWPSITSRRARSRTTAVAERGGSLTSAIFAEELARRQHRDRPVAIADPALDLNMPGLDHVHVAGIVALAEQHRSRFVFGGEPIDTRLSLASTGITYLAVEWRRIWNSIFPVRPSERPAPASDDSRFPGGSR